MDLFVLLALIAFGAAAVIAGVNKAWPICLIGVGLFLATLPNLGVKL